jgi:hypothetical protein
MIDLKAAHSFNLAPIYQCNGRYRDTPDQTNVELIFIQLGIIFY